MAVSVVDLDRLTAAGVRDGALDGKAITVLGLARSGIALARFFADAGARGHRLRRTSGVRIGAAIDMLGGRPHRVEAWAPTSNRPRHLGRRGPDRDFSEHQPRLSHGRAAAPRRPGGVVDAHRARSRTARRRSSARADLVLRLCPCPTIGVTGTKGKTTTSSLLAALLAADAAHPAVLGGNIGIPLVERLRELTPEHRVVIELSELQLPTLSRGTTVAVYTNVTADHLDRHGSLEALPEGQAAPRRAGRSRRARSSSTPTIRSWPGMP
jgi:hypothetical protein